ncbi:MAG TPA: GNAT family N-acetyltransferase [Sphingopyxis sp.]|nr:GNAT family N-acetyltransferase [Sphingopyxis sp.]
MMKVPDFQIQTARCQILRLTGADAGEVAAITDASVTDRVDFLPADFDLAAATALIDSMDRVTAYHGVRLIGTDALVGVIGVHAGEGQDLEIGTWFAAAARGQGLASETVSAVVRHLAALCPGCAIFAECAPANIPSWALLRRIGFAPSGQDGRRMGRRQLRWYAEAGQRIDVC